jgi:hypothetical protein
MTRNQARTALSAINWTLIGSQDGEIAIAPKGFRGNTREWLTYFAADYQDAVNTATAENTRCARQDGADFNYKLRFEAIIDFTRFQAVARKRNVLIYRVSVEKDMDFGGGEATFVADVDLNTIRGLLREVVDSHVMQETVAARADYTGIREYA